MGAIASPGRRDAAAKAAVAPPLAHARRPRVGAAVWGGSAPEVNETGDVGFVSSFFGMPVPDGEERGAGGGSGLPSLCRRLGNDALWLGHDHPHRIACGVWSPLRVSEVERLRHCCWRGKGR